MGIDNHIAIWSKGIPYEIAFWNNVFRWKHTFNGMMEWSNFNSVIDLEMFDVNSFLRGCGKEMPTVLDVGCGMSYATGNKMAVCGKELPLDMHYVDPLAAGKATRL